MPTLLDLAGIPVPSSCDGISAVSDEKRESLYGEVLENNGATRMLTNDCYKLIWYPAGNHLQLFDLESEFSKHLAAHCYGKDIDDGWIKTDQLIGYDPGEYQIKPDRTFTAQRGVHYPQPPTGTIADSVGFPD
jgi:arylsulfatase